MLSYTAATPASIISQAEPLLSADSGSSLVALDRENVAAEQQNSLAAAARGNHQAELEILLPNDANNPQEDDADAAEDPESCHVPLSRWICWLIKHIFCHRCRISAPIIVWIMVFCSVFGLGVWD